MTTPESPLHGISDERIHIVAEHKAIADLWVKLNAEALRNEHHAVRIITNGNGSLGRGVTAERVIVIGNPHDDLVDNAITGCRLGAAQVIRVSHVDRLAAGWRTG